MFDGSLRSGEDRIDGGEFFRKRTGIIVLLPLPSSDRANIRRDGVDRDSAVGAMRRCRRCLPAEAAEAFGAERPTGSLRRNAPARLQHVAGDGEFMGGRANIFCGVMKDEVLEVDEFAVDP
ncbi:hypothetical protein CN137_25470 [Sinorhizobium meliloti]|nr:hypothetical protein CN137_25470 [Sinorhizobium meliloti]